MITEDDIQDIIDRQEGLAEKSMERAAAAMENMKTASGQDLLKEAKMFDNQSLEYMWRKIFVADLNNLLEGKAPIVKP